MGSWVRWVAVLLLGSAVAWAIVGRRKVMVVNGFELPAAFVQLSQAPQPFEAPYEWELKMNVDAYGQPWETFGLRLYDDLEEIRSDTKALSEMFDEGRFQHDHKGYDPDRAKMPGDITGFTGVANFVWFGRSPTGEVFAFDFGTDPKEPSVVYWDESGYWRRVAPNFRIFMALFVPLGGDSDLSQKLVPLQPSDEAWKAAQPSPRDLLAEWTLYWVVTRHPAVQFESLASYYAACSEEERREVEAEVREELARRGMTNRQRRTLDGLWERLRASLKNDEDDEEEEEEVAPLTGLLFLEHNVPYYVLDMPPGAASDPSVFSRLVHAWAEITPEKRQEVEEEVREDLKFQDMTDKQRRRLEEVWERLRANLPS